MKSSPAFINGLPVTEYYTEVDRDFFIHNRQKNFENAMRIYHEAGKPENLIVIEPPDEVICDHCDTEITEPTITLVHQDRVALCSKCLHVYLKDLQEQRGFSTA